ncbi:MAG: glutathione S-transferase family protein [Deltaproteobacteria bacterium]|nr:glutathione S-transferase family protein [Deltaproteobacteria bacterium]
MPEIILHQYKASPFSEKIRRILAFKKMPWRSVEAAMMNPKPMLTPLTGGYRRIPVMQIGADIYCDSSLIARSLERLQPEPTIFPDGREGEITLFSLWADRHLFFSAVPVAMIAAADFLPAEFKADREAMSSQMNFEKLRKALPGARDQLRGFYDLFARQLEGRPFLMGESFSLADAAVYTTVWFLRSIPEAKALIESQPRLGEWFERCKGFGRGEKTGMEEGEALAIAREAAPATAAQADPQDPNGLRPGDAVAIIPDDYAFDPVKGEIVSLSIHEVAIRRDDPQVGEVVVHFPRIGFRISRDA